MMTAKSILLIPALAILLTGCSKSSDVGANPSNSPSTSISPSASSIDTTSLNLDDATWLAMMNAHHQQAIDMSDLSLTQTKNKEIKDLATSIRAAQYPELEYMNGLLYEGGYREPIDVSSHMSHMQGMLNEQQFAELGALSGSAFDKAFLTAMIAHHEGAVSMSQNIIVSGTNAKVKELAAKIVEVQNKEIVQMTILLGALK